MAASESSTPAATGAASVKMISDWRRDPDAYDPSARVCVFTLNGETFEAHSHRGDAPEQWPMVVRRMDGGYVRTVANWRRLPAELSAHLARTEG
jgi:hypothetical protein